MDKNAKQEEDKRPKFVKIIFKWAGYFLCLLVFVGVKQYFEQKQIIDRQKIVNTPEAIKVGMSHVNADDMTRFREAQTILMDGMTAEEKENYLAVLDKMRGNTATKQDLINNGLIINAVMSRLHDDKKIIVQKFLSDAEGRFGNDMVKAYDK